VKDGGGGYSYINLVHKQSFNLTQNNHRNNLAVTSLHISCFLNNDTVDN